MKNKKILILGITGTSFDFLYPLIKKGLLVNFEKILNKGVSGGIKTVYPPLHSVAWTSFFTGKVPGKHGVFDATHDKKAHPLTLDNINSDTLLDILERIDKKNIFINVPLSNVRNYKNTTIIKRLSPSHTDTGDEELFVWPESLKDELKKNLKNYENYTEKDFDSRRLNKIIKDLYKSLEVQSSTILYLIKNKEYDLMTAVFTETDRLLHLLWNSSDSTHPEYDNKKAAEIKNVIIDFYKKLDEKLGDIMDAIDDDVNLFVFSDFGVAPIKKFVDINAWLIENGYLKIKKTAKNEKVNKNIFLKSSMKEDTKFAGFSLAQIKGENDFKKRYNALCRLFISKKDIDWTKTKAFSAGSYGQVFINLKIKYGHGIVKDEDYKGLVEELETKMKGIKDPENGHRFIYVTIKKENMTGKMTDLAPDLTIITENPEYYPFSSLHEENISLYQKVFSTFTGHKLNGLLMAIGKDIKSGAFIDFAHIRDILPTILYLLGIDIPNDIDGKVIKEAIKKSHLKEKKVLDKLRTVNDKAGLWNPMKPVKVGG